MNNSIIHQRYQSKYFAIFLELWELFWGSFNGGPFVKGSIEGGGGRYRHITDIVVFLLARLWLSKLGGGIIIWWG